MLQMSKRLLLLFFSAITVATVVPTRVSLAACNTLPDPPSGGYKMTTTQRSQLLLFRSPFGRINQAVLAIGDDGISSFDVAPPSANECKAVIDSQQRCAAISSIAKKTTLNAWLVGRATSPADAIIVPLEATLVSEQPPLVSLKLQASGVRAKKLGALLDKRVAIVLANEKTFPSAVGTESCAAVAQKSAGVLACIDSLCLGNDCDAVSSPTRELRILARENDFADVCRRKSKDPGAMPRCKEDADNPNPKLAYHLDEGGDIYADFNWKTMLRCDTDGSGKEKCDGRLLFGSLAVRRFGSSGEHIRIPGREFLGSTIQNDNDRGVGNAKRSKPFFDVAPDNRDNELNLYGVTDQDTSRLYLFRRYPVTRTCPRTATAPEQACQGVVSGIEICACDDDSNPPRTCTCEAHQQSRYYVCDRGPHDGEPCTRPSHCREGDDKGTCSAMPKCFDPANPTGPDGKPCTNDWEDALWPGGDQCDKGQFCDKGLFYLGRSTDDAWDYLVTAGSNPSSGVCEKDGAEGDGVLCQSNADCATCVGYRLQVSPNP